MLTFYTIYILIPLVIGCGLDLFFGDPLSARHPVALAGRLIAGVEEKLRNMERFRAGILTVLIVCGVCVLVPTAGILLLARLAALLSPAAGKAAGSAACALLCWQLLAAKGLRTESMKVYAALENGETMGDHNIFPEAASERLDQARQAVSMIVGRDTEALDEDGIIRAAVETVAENTSDGVIAPMFYMALLGIPGMLLYKAVNTMDSMIGYKNEKYILYGRAAARTDDGLNFIPARISGMALIAAACLHRECDGRRALTVFRRDRRLSSSPNAGCCESAVAGALGVQLLGPASYFGIKQEKPYIGDPVRPVEREDIRRANELMYLAAGLFLLLIIAAAGLAAIVG